MRLEVKYIEVDGEFKALVLNMGQSENRLQALFESVSLQDVVSQALAYVESLKVQSWH